MSENEKDSQKTVKIKYTNYRGETGVREIEPIQIWFGATEWHPELQWLLDAFDIEKGAQRSFAVKDISEWLSS